MEQINWKKELLESGNFNKFQRNLLENGAKNYMQGIYMGYLYSRWRKLKGLNINDPLENKGQLQSSFKEFAKKIDYHIQYLYLIMFHQTSYWMINKLHQLPLLASSHYQLQKF